MRNLRIEFELSAPLNEYRYLSFKLATLRAQKLADGAWLVSTDETADELTAELADLLRSGDRLQVVSSDASDSGSLDPKQPF
jgi:hypothetical protein